MQPTPARSPTLKLATSAPTAVTTPTISCLGRAAWRVSNLPWIDDSCQSMQDSHQCFAK